MSPAKFTPKALPKEESAGVSAGAKDASDKSAAATAAASNIIEGNDLFNKGSTEYYITEEQCFLANYGNWHLGKVNEKKKESMWNCQDCAAKMILTKTGEGYQVCAKMTGLDGPHMWHDYLHKKAISYD